MIFYVPWSVLLACFALSMCVCVLYSVQELAKTQRDALERFRSRCCTDMKGHGQRDMQHDCGGKGC